MAVFSGSEHMRMHIRFGEPVPTRPILDPEAATTYALSGLDTARELLQARRNDDRECHVLAGKVIRRILDLRYLVAGGSVAPPPLLAGLAPYTEMRTLGSQAKAVHEAARRRICRLYFKRVIIMFGAISLCLMILPAEIWIAPLVFVIWRLLKDGGKEEVARLEEKVAVAAEIRRAADLVADIVRFQTNLVVINF